MLCKNKTSKTTVNKNTKKSNQNFSNKSIVNYWYTKNYKINQLLSTTLIKENQKSIKLMIYSLFPVLYDITQEKLWA